MEYYEVLEHEHYSPCTYSKSKCVIKLCVAYFIWSFSHTDESMLANRDPETNSSVSQVTWLQQPVGEKTVANFQSKMSQA